MYQDIFFFSNRLETVAAHSLADRLDDAEGGGIFDSYEFAFNIYYYAELTLPTDARFFCCKQAAAAGSGCARYLQLCIYS